MTLDEIEAEFKEQGGFLSEEKIAWLVAHCRELEAEVAALREYYNAAEKRLSILDENPYSDVGSLELQAAREKVKHG